MGKKIIVKGANFTTNAITNDAEPILEPLATMVLGFWNHVETGSTKHWWSNEDLRNATGNYHNFADMYAGFYPAIAASQGEYRITIIGDAQVSVIAADSAEPGSNYTAGTNGVYNATYTQGDTFTSTQILSNRSGATHWALDIKKASGEKVTNASELRRLISIEEITSNSESNE